MKEYVVEIEGLVPETVVVALQKDLTIGRDLDNELDKAAALFGYYAVLAETAFSRVKAVETQFEIWEAKELRLIMREKDKPDPKWMLDIEVKALPKWFNYQNKIRQYAKEARILKAVATAFENKLKLVQTKNANRRKELS